jgi:hypothetical protein
VLAQPGSLQRFQAVARRNAQVRKVQRGFNLIQLA